MDPRYTPTTEEVRTAWFQLTQNTESFDRWLESTMHKAHIAEQDRMIQILERLGEHGMTHSERCLGRHWVVERASEEIKGDSK